MVWGSQESTEYVLVLCTAKYQTDRVCNLNTVTTREEGEGKGREEGEEIARKALGLGLSVSKLCIITITNGEQASDQSHKMKIATDDRGDWVLRRGRRLSEQYDPSSR